MAAAIIGKPSTYGYIANDHYYFTFANDRQFVSVAVRNKPKAITSSISVQKVDAYGNKLPGAVFTVESSTDGSTSTKLIETSSERIIMINKASKHGALHRKATAIM